VLLGADKHHAACHGFYFSAKESNVWFAPEFHIFHLSDADKSAFCIDLALSAQGRGAPSSGFALYPQAGPSGLPLPRHRKRARRSPKDWKRFRCCWRFWLIFWKPGQKRFSWARVFVLRTVLFL